MEYNSILSTALNSKERLLKLIGYPSEIFVGNSYQIIMDELKELSKTEIDIDLPVLVSRLKSVDKYKIVEAVILEIYKGETTVNFDYQVKQLCQDARTRDIITTQIDWQKKQITEAEAVARYDEIDRIYALEDDTCIEMSDFADKPFDEMFPKDNFIPWRLQAFNDKLIGMFKGNFIIVAGEPGTGKTTFINGEARVGRPLYFNLEITRAENFAKYLQEETGVYVKKILANKYLTADDMDKINKAKIKLKNELNIKMYDRKNDDFNFIISKIKFELMTGDYDKIIVDNLQRVRNIGDGEAGVSNLTGTLKQMAKDFQIPIIGLSHLIKSAYTTSIKPTLGSLKGGGSLIQDADCVIFLYRDENGQAVFDCQKDRFGVPGSIPNVVFDEHFGVYRDAHFSDHVEPSTIEY